jgi:hypothetical protein
MKWLLLVVVYLRQAGTCFDEIVDERQSAPSDGRVYWGFSDAVFFVKLLNCGD